MPRAILEGWLCCRCEHKWVPREEETPRVCPKCKSPYWNKQKRIDINNDLKQTTESSDIVTMDNGLFIPIKQIESTFVKEELEKALKSIVSKSGKIKKG